MANIFSLFERRSAVQTHDILPFRNIDEVIRATEYSSIRAIENSAVYTAISTIAGDVSTLPVKVKQSKYEYNEELEYLLNVEPNQVMTAKDLKFILVANAILNGNSYAEIVRENGIPVSIHHVPNENVMNVKKKSTTKHLTSLEYVVKNFGDKAGTRIIKGEDMIHIKPFTLNGIVGESPLKALASELETEKHSKNFFANFFRNGTQSGGIIRVAGDLNSDDKEAVRDAWQEANSGTDNAHRVIVLDESTSYEPIRVDTEILKLINDNKNNVVKVAMVLGLPLHKMKIETHSMSLEESNSDYVVNTLNDYLTSIQSELNRKMFIDKDMRKHNQFVFDTDVYKYVDAKTKREIIKSDYELGLISLNEAREELGKQPLENDRHIQSLNYMNSELIDSYQMEKAKQVQKNVVDEEPLEGGEI